MAGSDSSVVLRSGPDHVNDPHADSRDGWVTGPCYRPPKSIVRREVMTDPGTEKPSVNEDQATTWPVELLPGEEPEAPPLGTSGLCLSGGGSRAMLFHVGALTRLNELGVLRSLDRISSVSGG